MSVLKILLTVLYLSKCFETKNCTCVPFYKCDYTIISDGKISGGRSNDCEGFLKVCCVHVARPSALAPSKKATIGCGLQSPENFPWSAALFYRPYPYFMPSYKCRISLIHEQVAITAAHCVHVEGSYQITIDSTIRTVKYVHKHPSFNPQTLQNDIALLILHNPVAEGNIGTVCIPGPGAILDGGTNCTTIIQGEYMKIVSRPLVSSTECVKKLRETALGPFFNLHQSFLCAGGGNYDDPREGVGGSALICPIPGVPGRYQQGGIVAWGLTWGNFPEVYVNLAYFREWIDDVMRESEFGTASYTM